MEMNLPPVPGNFGIAILALNRRFLQGSKIDEMGIFPRMLDILGWR